ncbi:hypothetical protein [Chryseobacterium wanjuense]
MKIKHVYFLLAILATESLVSAQVGINTANPQASLDVVGNGSNTSFKDGIIAPRVSKQQLASKVAGTYGSGQNGALVYVTDITTPSGVTPSLVQVANVNTTGYYYFNGILWVAASPADVNIYNSDGTLQSNRVVTTAGNQLNFTGFNANITIATATTEGRVSITGSARASVGLASGTSVFNMFQDNANLAQISTNGTSTGLNLTTLNATPLNFLTSGVNRMIVTSGGNVGIGTISPDTKLHVVSTVASANRYNIIDATNGTNQYGIVALRNTSALATGNFSLIGFTNSGPTSGGANWVLGSVRTGATLANGSEEDFYIGNSTGGGLIERMRINPTTGNVGIGISTATNKLHVNATNPVRLEGLQAAAGTAGSLVVDNTGVVQLRNSSSISAVRATGNLTITVNNLATNTNASAAPTETFDNLNEFTGNTFTAAATGLYKVDFQINYPQRVATEDGGDGYLGYAYINLNASTYTTVSTKVTLPETSGAPSYNTCVNSVLVKMTAGNTLTFQAIVYGSTANTANITTPYIINIVRID